MIHNHCKKTVFPESIENFLTDVIELLDRDQFFTGDNIPEGYDDFARTIFWNEAGNYLVPHFITGEEGFASEQDLEDLLVNTIVIVTMDKLMETGICNGIEDENGEYIYWLTDKGTEMGKELIKEVNQTYDEKVIV